MSQRLKHDMNDEGVTLSLKVRTTFLKRYSCTLPKMRCTNTYLRRRGGWARGPRGAGGDRGGVGRGSADVRRSELTLPQALGRVCASSAAATPVAKEMRVRCGFHDHGGLVSAFRPLPLPARAATADPDALPAAPDCN